MNQKLTNVASSIIDMLADENGYSVTIKDANRLLVEELEGQLTASTVATYVGYVRMAMRSLGMIDKKGSGITLLAPLMEQVGEVAAEVTIEADRLVRARRGNRKRNHKKAAPRMTRDKAAPAVKRAVTFRTDGKGGIILARGTKDLFRLSAKEKFVITLGNSNNTVTVDYL